MARILDKTPSYPAKRKNRIIAIAKRKPEIYHNTKSDGIDGHMYLFTETEIGKFSHWLAHSRKNHDKIIRYTGFYFHPNV